MKIETMRLNIVPFTGEYLKCYYEEFTESIVKFQYPDAFKSIEDAKKLVLTFVEDMKQGKMLELVILSKENEFLGSLEVFGLNEGKPELGLWIKENEQGKGYGKEALGAIIDYLNSTGKYTSYIYEVDKRNIESIRLVKKFNGIEEGSIEVTTESGKQLFLKQFIISKQAD